MKRRKNNKYVYLVYCNPEPIVYATYKRKQDAVRHATMLIRYRKKRSEELGHDFDYYHFRPFISKVHSLDTLKKYKDCPYEEGTVFSACLKIKDDNKDWSDDRCEIRIDRKVLN